MAKNSSPASTTRSLRNAGLYTSGSCHSCSTRPLTFSILPVADRSLSSSTQRRKWDAQMKEKYKEGGNRATVQQSPLYYQNIRTLYTPKYDKQPTTLLFHESTHLQRGQRAALSLCSRHLPREGTTTTTQSCARHPGTHSAHLSAHHFHARHRQTVGCDFESGSGRTQVHRSNVV